MLIIIKIQTFLKSLLWHISQGLPKSNQSTIDYRYSICITCDEFDKTNSQCSVCGCSISNKSVFLNKLAWLDQECPLGKWKGYNK